MFDIIKRIYKILQRTKQNTWSHIFAILGWLQIFIVTLWDYKLTFLLIDFIFWLPFLTILIIDIFYGHYYKIKIPFLTENKFYNIFWTIGFLFSVVNILFSICQIIYHRLLQLHA